MVRRCRTTWTWAQPLIPADSSTSPSCLEQPRTPWGAEKTIQNKIKRAPVLGTNARCQQKPDLPAPTAEPSEPQAAEPSRSPRQESLAWRVELVQPRPHARVELSPHHVAEETEHRQAKTHIRGCTAGTPCVLLSTRQPRIPVSRAGHPRVREACGRQCTTTPSVNTKARTHPR